MGLFVEIEFQGGMAVSNSEQHIGFVASYDFRIFEAQFREHILDVQGELKVGVQLSCFAVRAIHRPHRPSKSIQAVRPSNTGRCADSCISGVGRFRLQLNGPLQNGVRAGGYLEFRVPPGGQGLGKLRRHHRLR